MPSKERIRLTAPRIRCHAKNRRGERCQRWAAPGQKVCASHGAKSPQAQHSARQRLEEAADPVAARLVKLALETADERVLVMAATAVLDRGGCHPTQAVRFESPDAAKAALARLLGVDASQLPEE